MSSNDDNSLHEYQDEASNDLDNIRLETNTDEVEGSHITDTEDNNPEHGDGEGKTVKPKRVIKNPQPKLNEQTLKGPRGLLGLEKCFDRVKFKGKGHEEQDLNVIMKMYEYWCHRLFPKFPFDSCIDRLEKLGKKRPTVTLLKKIRYDMITDEEKPIHSDNEEDKVMENADGTDFDQIRQLPPLEEPQLSEEQLERIRQNRERAARIRQQKLLRTVDSHSQEEGSSRDNNTTNVNGFESAVIESSSTHDNEAQSPFDVTDLPCSSKSSKIIDKALLNVEPSSSNNEEFKDTVEEDVMNVQSSSPMRKENEVLRRIREKAARNVAESNFLPGKIDRTKNSVTSDSDSEMQDLQRNSQHFPSGSRTRIISSSESD